MLINLRNALMSGKRLPYDAEVEFLQSSGTQYINTGIMGASEWHITAQGAATPTTSNCVIATTSSGGSFFGNYGAIDYWAVGNGSSWRCSLPYTSIGSFIVTFSASSVQFTVDGETVTRSSAPNFSKAFCLFSTNGEGFGATVRVYGCKVYQNGVLVRDFIPVRKGTVGYLYDRVSGALFGNAGTGDFVLGPDVVPVEYIESHGTEYIDTGVIGNSSTKVELKAQGTNTSVNQTLCGGRDSNGLYNFSVWQRSTLLGAYGMRWDYLATNTVAGDGYVLDGVWNTSQPNLVVKDGANNYLNGVQLGANASASFSCNFPLALFAMNTGGSKGNFFVGKMFMCKISNNNTPTRNYTPVRVGTEGAMMDVLTRRIYRNAGTGAFTYGNDLKYPIPSE